MQERERRVAEAYSQGVMSALEARRRLGEVSYGDLLRLLSEAGLPLPQASQAGREAEIARARDWLFSRHAA